MTNMATKHTIMLCQIWLGIQVFSSSLVSAGKNTESTELSTAADISSQNNALYGL